MGVEVLSGFEREGVVASLGVGELDLVPDLEGPTSAGGTGRFRHVTSVPVFPGAPTARPERVVPSVTSAPVPRTPARAFASTW